MEHPVYFVVLARLHRLRSHESRVKNPFGAQRRISPFVPLRASRTTKLSSPFSWPTISPFFDQLFVTNFRADNPVLITSLQFTSFSHETFVWLATSLWDMLNWQRRCSFEKDRRRQRMCERIEYIVSCEKGLKEYSHFARHFSGNTWNLIKKIISHISTHVRKVQKV